MSNIQIKQVSLSFGDRSVFSGLNLSIPSGKKTAILGQSGAGKTTILRLISGQVAPDSGTILVDGVDVHRQTQKDLYAMRLQMGYLYQQGALFPHLNIFENVAFPLRQHFKLPECMIRDTVLLRLEAVGLRGARHLFPETLSGGMKQRAALARATILDPETVLYDEPFSGQDPISKSTLIQLIESFSSTDRPVTAVIVSHDIQEVLSIADYVYVLLHDGVAAAGTPEEVQADTQPDVRRFLAGETGDNVQFHYPHPDILSDLELAE